MMDAWMMDAWMMDDSAWVSARGAWMMRGELGESFLGLAPFTSFSFPNNRPHPLCSPCTHRPSPMSHPNPISSPPISPCTHLLSTPCTYPCTHHPHTLRAPTHAPPCTHHFSPLPHSHLSFLNKRQVFCCSSGCIAMRPPTPNKKDLCVSDQIGVRSGEVRGKGQPKKHAGWPSQNTEFFCSSCLHPQLSNDQFVFSGYRDGVRTGAQNPKRSKKSISSLPKKKIFQAFAFQKKYFLWTLEKKNLSGSMSLLGKKEKKKKENPSKRRKTHRKNAKSFLLLLLHRHAPTNTHTGKPTKDLCFLGRWYGVQSRGGHAGRQKKEKKNIRKNAKSFLLLLLHRHAPTNTHTGKPSKDL